MSDEPDWVRLPAVTVNEDDTPDWAKVQRGPVASPDDHGLAERQKLSPMGKALSPITSLPENYRHMRNEAVDQMSRGVGQFFKPKEALDPVYGAGNMLFGGMNFTASPINAAYRSIVGQPLEDTTGIPREHTEFAAQLATPGLGFTKLPKAPGAIAETMPNIRPTSAGAERAKELEDEFGIKYSRGQAEGDLDAIRYEDMAARGAYGPEAQERASGFFNDQFNDVQAAGRGVSERLSPHEQPINSPADAGASLNAELAGRAAEARGTRDAATGLAEREAGAARTASEEGSRTIGDAIRGSVPAIDNPREAGEIINRATRERAAAHRADFNQLYDEFRDLPGSIERAGIDGMSNRIRHDLSYADNPVVVDDQLTPAATRALGALDDMTLPANIRNRANAREPVSADTQEVAVTLRGVDQMRRRLVSYLRSAASPEDRRAMHAIMESFDGQIEGAIQQGLFSGDPRALQALQEARSSYSNYRRLYSPRGAGDDVGTAMRRIVERNATPEETANLIVGSGKIGQAGLPVRIADRLQEILGADSPEWNSIRQAMWQKASQVRATDGSIHGARSATSILDFAGSSLAERMFTQPELTAMCAHANGVRNLDRVIEALPSTGAARRATEGYEAAFGGGNLTGPQKAVFQRIIENRATPEETVNTVFNVIGGGNNSGHAQRALQAIRNIVGEDSQVWSAVRQGVWQKLIQNPASKDPKGQQLIAQNIGEFLNGNGRSVASELFSHEERAMMNRYQEAVKKTVIPKYAKTMSDTAPALMHTVRKYAAGVATALGAVTHGGITGGLEGYGVGKLIDKGAEKYKGMQTMRKLNDSLDNAPGKEARKYPNPLAAPVVPLAGTTQPNRRDHPYAP